MNEYIFISIILIHWIADFIFQDEKWANDKSKSFFALLLHTSVYSLVWMGILIIAYLPFNLSTTTFVSIVAFGWITLFFHTLTDYFTSKRVSKKFKAGYYGSKIPNFGAFTEIGFDQVLHYVQLVLTWKLLLNGL